MEEGGYWRPSCSSLSLAEHHGSTGHLCARHAPQPRVAHRHAPHAHAHTHHRVPHTQHAASCPVHSPFRQPAPDYCAAHSQTFFTIC
ncbi:histidine-rich glycoprotein-like [Ostrinia furnacalis]|uniref:histidine-rich glycoprotein-like n=1 Tax=Ostrinia furnacalis TaxID=93504 RepID=UPI00103F92D6|nr:histidine-rich glycoprotein-like [Ostrinia furnacalis]